MRRQLLDVSWQVQYSPPDNHSDILPSPLWHSVVWRYFDNSPFPTHATMNAHAFDWVVLQGHSRLIPVFYRDNWLIPCRRLLATTLFSIYTLPTTVSVATSDLHVVLCIANHPHAHKGNCLVSHVEHSWMGNRLLELQVKWVSSGDGPAKSLERRPFRTRPVQACRRIAQMLSGGLQVATQRTTTSSRRHAGRPS